MRITAQLRRGAKMHILLDGKYSLTVTRDFWYAAGIAQGAELTDAEWGDFSERAGRAKALDSGLRLLAYRDHSKQELTRKLRERAGAELAEAAVERIAEMGLLDDRRYAARLAGELSERKGYAPRRVVQELIRRGVDLDIAREAAEELPALLEPREKIQELLETRFARQLGGGGEKERKRTIDALLRLGYTYGDIRAALAEYVDIEVDNNAGM